MNFKRYPEKIKKKTEKIQPKSEDEATITEDTITDQEIEPEVRRFYVLWTKIKIHVIILKDTLKNPSTKIGFTEITQVIQYTKQ